ncbi:MAG: acyltransferase family protein, partial [Burkholderiaceae bacterium]
FFVISGFLITGLIQRALESGRFSFAAFYGRRARRLLPAAYVVLGLTLAAAPWALNRKEQLDLVGQALGALGFATNVVLWQQTGYFQGAAEAKPLLHFWSLALEEQYYLVLPALMVMTAARLRVWLVIAVTLLSLALLAAWAPSDPSAAFYLLPARAWELGLGSIGALMGGAVAGPMAQRVLRAISWPAWALLLIVPVAPGLVGAAHPGPAALVVGLATLVLLVRAPARTPAAFAPLVSIGDRSYALYLVHWPLLAMLHNAWVGLASQSAALLPWRVGAVLLAFPLAWALHRVVERPAKAALTGARGAWVLGGGTAVIAGAAWALWAMPVSQGPVDFVELRKPNYGLSAHCDAEQPFDDRPECRTRPGARWLVWGDSYAMHLVPGIVDVAGQRGVVQATKSTCGPFPGVTPVRPDLREGSPWIAQCADFNASVMAWVGRHPEIDTVILSSLLTQYLDDDKYKVRRGDGTVITGTAAMSAALQDDFERTIRRLKALGKRVIVIAPPPSASFDIAGCLEREQAGRWTLGAQPGCMIDQAEDARRRAAEHRLIDRIAASTTVLRFEPLLCHEGRCDVRQEGVPLYRDQGHLSHEGSRRLLPALMRSAHQ